jgi:hypothetical protein
VISLSQVDGPSVHVQRAYYPGEQDFLHPAYYPKEGRILRGVGSVETTVGIDGLAGDLDQAGVDQIVRHVEGQ